MLNRFSFLPAHRLRARKEKPARNVGRHYSTVLKRVNHILSFQKLISPKTMKFTVRKKGKNEKFNFASI